MSMQARRFCLAAFIVASAGTSPLLAVNRFFINNQTLDLGSTGNIVPVRADVDQDTFGFSIHLQYDATKVRVTAVQLGSATSPLSPEYSNGTLSVAPAPGSVVHGVVFDTSGPTITKKLSAGTNLEVLRLVVDVIAPAAGSTVLNLVNVPGSGSTPSKLNVMTNANGDSVAPSPTLVDGTLTLQQPSSNAPIIDSFLQNSGLAGQQFVISGQNFDAPGLAVEVCGVTVAHTLLPDDSIQVNAPACGSTGWAAVEVCTNNGCDTEAEGFFYEESGGTTFVRGNSNNDATVDLSDAVAILNDLFLGQPATAPCRDALDSNDSGATDISDGVFILNFLFLGGAPIPAPYPDPGLDPTVDALPDC